MTQINYLKIYSIFALSLLSSCHFARVQSNINNVSFDVIYKFSLTGKTSKIKFICLIPKTIEDRQSILDVNYSVTPSKIYDVEGNRYAEFVFLNPEHDFEIKISVKAQLIRYDLDTALNNFKATDGMIPIKYLIEEKYLEKNNPSILEASKRSTGKTQIDTIENIYYYVLENIEYAGYNPTDLGAAKALKLKKGDCSEFTDLFVVICRTKGIPARVIVGYNIECENTPKHAWAEIYIKGCGWVPFDPTLGELWLASFERLSPEYIYLSNVRNDKVLNNRHYYTCRYWGGPVKVTDSFSTRQ